jgi:uncharacterized protein with HEPN domain
MQSISNEKIIDMLDYVKHQAEFVIETTKNVSAYNDFLLTQEGIVLYNSSCMCMQTIGETLKQIDNLTEHTLLCNYHNIPWQHVFGMRNIIAHEYASTDPEIIFNSIKEDLQPLLDEVNLIILDFQDGKYKY